MYVPYTPNMFARLLHVCMLLAYVTVTSITSCVQDQSDVSKDTLLSTYASARPSRPPTYLATTWRPHTDTANRAHSTCGDLAANNPTLLAMTHVSKLILMCNKDFFPIKSADYGKFLILSLGTRSAKLEGKFGST